MSVEAALLKIGSAIATAVGKAWLSNRQAAATRQLTLAELVTARAPGLIPQRRMHRQLEQLAESVASRLEEFASVEIGNLAPNERLAALDAVAATLGNSNLTDDRVLEADVTTHGLYELIRPTSEETLRSTFLDEAGTAYYDRVLRESIDYVAEVITALPSFDGRALRELLSRDSMIIDLLNEVLDRMPQRSSRDAGREFELEYRREIARKLDKVEIFGVTLSGPTRRYPLTVSYIDLSASGSSTTGTEQGNELLTEPIENVLARSDRLLLRGEAGSGKTTLLSWLAVRSAQQSFDGPLAGWNNSVPFFIQLRHYSDKPLPAISELRGMIGWQLGDGPESWHRDILRSGRGLLLVDGVDEISEVRRPDVYGWLDDLVSSFPACRYIVSSRPPAAVDDWLRDLSFLPTELQPMSPRHIRAFIEHWHDAAAIDASPEEQEELPNYREYLKEVIDRSTALKSLASNPLLCALICALNKDRRSQLPSDRTELYYTALDMLLARRDTERRIRDQRSGDFSLQEKLALLGSIAYWFTRNELVHADRDRVINQISIALNALAGRSDDPKEVYKYLLVRSGLLREPVAKKVDFVHKSFQEYLAARSIVEDDSIEMLMRYVDDDIYREIIVLAAGLARPREQAALLKSLIEKAKNTRNSAQRVKLQLLCAQCLETANRVPTELHREVTRMMADVVPPRSAAQARALASIGPEILPLLPTNDLTEREAIATVRTAGLIGGDTALALLSTLATDGRRTVSSEVFNCWQYFEPINFAEEVLKKIPDIVSRRIVVSEPKLLPGVAILPSQSVVVNLSEDVTEEELRQTAALPNLRELQLSGALPTQDLTWLAHSARLSRIEILATCPTSLHGIGALPALTALSYHFNSGLPAKRVRHFYDQSDELRLANEIEAVSAATRLTNLALLLHEVHTLFAIISELPQLRSLHLRRCGGMTSPADLGSHDRIQELNLRDCEELAQLSGLDNFSNLRTLSVSGAARLTDIGYLRYISGLRSLSIEDCQNVHMTDLRGADHDIRNLTISGTYNYFSLADVVGPELRRIALTDLPWAPDLAALRDHSTLQHLDLSRCGSGEMIDLAPLAGILNLRVIHTGNVVNAEALHPTSRLAARTTSWI